MNEKPEQGRAMVVARQVTPDQWGMIAAIASEAHKAHTLGVTSQAEAAMKILTGYELGLPAMASLRIVYIIKGKAAIQPKGAWALIVGHPDFAGIVEERLVDDKDKFVGYAITLKRKNGMQARRQFTLADAARAGLADKDNWRGYPEHCCYWRAQAFAQDVVFPDVLMGLYRADEIGANITPEGEVIEGKWEPAPAQLPTATEKPDKPFPTPTVKGPIPEPDGIFQKSLDDLIEKYGVDAVLAAGDGSVPSNRQEVAAILRKVEAEAATVTTEDATN